METVIGWPTAAVVSGHTAHALRKLVREGKLTAHKDELHRNVFARDDLEALRPGQPPSETATGPGGVESALPLNLPDPEQANPEQAAQPESAQPEPTQPEAAVPTPVQPEPTWLDAEHGVAVTALVFDALEKGATMPAIVVTHRLPPDLVMSIFRKWKELKEVDLNASSVPQQLANAARCYRSLSDRQDETDKALIQLLDRVGGMPFPERERFVCEHCKERGHVGVLIHCSDCGTQHWWGFSKKKE